MAETQERGPAVLDGIIEEALLQIDKVGYTRVHLHEGQQGQALARLREMGLAQPETARSREVKKRETNHTLTPNGLLALAETKRYRKREDQGMPLTAWRHERAPWGLEQADFEAIAVYRMNTSEEDEVEFHSDGRLMLRGPNPLWNTSALHTPTDMGVNTLLDETAWAEQKTEPVGYFFQRGQALIAFNRKLVVVRADYFDIIAKHIRTNATWVTLYHKDGEPGSMPAALRADTPAQRGAAYVAPFTWNGKLPGLAGLIR